VFSDPRAAAHPVSWAVLHTAFVVAEVIGVLATWRMAALAQAEATTRIEAEQAKAAHDLSRAAEEAAHRERTAVADAASRLDEREQLARRLDGVLASTAQTGVQIGGEADTTMTEMSEALRQISAASQSASTDLDQAVTDSAASQAVISELERSIANISSVAQLIQGVAEQTNLLALNATIEAARAGEAGRGFGVVAEEVKTLAAQTAAATARIENTVAEVRSGAEAMIKAVAGVGNVLHRVAGAQQQVREIVGNQTERVEAAHVSLARAAQQVAGAVEEARRIR
jgi:methyl-accepting chemotaxis protein